MLLIVFDHESRSINARLEHNRKLEVRRSQLVGYGVVLKAKTQSGKYILTFSHTSLDLL
jgi:hypothetical protein